MAEIRIEVESPVQVLLATIQLSLHTEDGGAQQERMSVLRLAAKNLFHEAPSSLGVPLLERELGLRDERGFLARLSVDRPVGHEQGEEKRKMGAAEHHRESIARVS